MLKVVPRIVSFLLLAALVGDPSSFCHLNERLCSCYVFTPNRNPPQSWRSDGAGGGCSG